MHLANYNATWNSRKGAAFGFSTIAAKAGDQLEEHLPKIIPKLYRYQVPSFVIFLSIYFWLWSNIFPAERGGGTIWCIQKIIYTPCIYSLVFSTTRPRGSSSPCPPSGPPSSPRQLRENNSSVLFEGCFCVRGELCEFSPWNVKERDFFRERGGYSL